MRKILLICFSLLCFCWVSAQEFTTHAVKQGETLYGIARKYAVSPSTILRFNKELRKDEPLQPNTILVIPLDSKAANLDVQPAAVVLEKGEGKLTQEPIEPERFENHRVRRKETLFGIAKEYGIRVEDIKRYNKTLYANPLKKGMRLRIPVFPENAPVTEVSAAGDFISYTVQPKDTRWSIAHRYGITVDSLESLNPSLAASTSYLAEGQVLKLPKPEGVEGQESAMYDSYVVPQGMTMYSIGKKYGLSSQEIIELNPEIVEQGGLKVGMTLRLPRPKAEELEVNSENYVFYEVKPKQTTYSLTRNLGLGYDELVKLNPELVSGLKAGMVLKIPRKKAIDLEVKNSLVLDKVNLMDSINPALRPRLLFLLPFRTGKVNFADEELAAKTVTTRNDIQYSLGLYSGALVAMDSIADLGVSVEAYTFDNDLSLQKTREILRRENLEQYDAIFGPLDQASFREVAVQAARAEVPVLAAVPVSDDLNLNNVFFSQTPEDILRQRMLDYMSTQVTDQNLIVIADDKHQDVSTKIRSAFPQAKVLPVIEEEENISIDFEELTLLLSEEKENWVFVESDNFKLVASITSILNSANTETTPVRMFTSHHGKAYENPVISGSHLSNLRFTFPSVYREVADDAFVKKYREMFNSIPDKYAVRGFDVTMDLLLKLAYKKDLFEASKGVGTTEYSGNKFNYGRTKLSGFYNTSSYILTYEDMQIKEINP